MGRTKGMFVFLLDYLSWIMMEWYKRVNYHFDITNTSLFQLICGSKVVFYTFTLPS